jgi:hypothetical protein
MHAEDKLKITMDILREAFSESGICLELIGGLGHVCGLAVWW